jgi:hypothetical protein
MMRIVITANKNQHHLVLNQDGIEDKHVTREGAACASFPPSGVV